MLDVVLKFLFSLSLHIFCSVGFYVSVYINIGLADEKLCFMFDGFLF